MLTWPVLGMSSWRAWPRVSVDFSLRPETAVTAYQTTTGFVRHFCQPAGATAAGCGPAAWLLPVVLLLVALIITCAVSRHRPARAWIAAGICLSLLMLPVAEDHQFVALAIPMFLLGAAGIERRQAGWWVLVAILYLVPEQWTWDRDTTGWTALLAYPRLYATWLLWALALRAPDRNPTICGTVGRVESQPL